MLSNRLVIKTYAARKTTLNDTSRPCYAHAKCIISVVFSSIHGKKGLVIYYQILIIYNIIYTALLGREGGKEQWDRRTLRQRLLAQLKYDFYSLNK